MPAVPYDRVRAVLKEVGRTIYSPSHPYCAGTAHVGFSPTTFFRGVEGVFSDGAPHLKIYCEYRWNSFVFYALDIVRFSLFCSRLLVLDVFYV